MINDKKYLNFSILNWPCSHKTGYPIEFSLTVISSWGDEPLSSRSNATKWLFVTLKKFKLSIILMYEIN